MDRLDVALELIKEAKAEKQRLIRFENDVRRDGWAKASYDWYGFQPHKSLINQNLKTARRLLLDEYVK